MSDETNGRDTHFQGFAKLLWQELLYASQSKAVGNVLVRVSPEQKDAEAIIAQRAYDLLFHAIKHSTPYQQNDRIIKYIISHIPDMTEWP